MSTIEMVHPNITELRKIEEQAKEHDWPWNRSFSYEVAVAADELDKSFPSEKAIAIARAKLHKWMGVTPEEGEAAKGDKLYRVQEK